MVEWGDGKVCACSGVETQGNQAEDADLGLGAPLEWIGFAFAGLDGLLRACSTPCCGE